MFREKYNLIQELQKKSEELVGINRLAMVGQGDFSGANNTMRGTMNNKHHVQHLAIDNPEFPFFFDGKENVAGDNSSFYTRTKKEYKIIRIVKKYDGLMRGKTNFALYFLYCKEDDSYKLVERKEVENLTETFGFDYNNEYLDDSSEGDIIPANTTIQASRSYDGSGNVGIGLNGRILYGVDPAVQDDAIIVSESFAKRAVVNNITTKVVQIPEGTVLLNLYGRDGAYQGLPNIGDVVHNGIICATRAMKEPRLLSDFRDISLCNINQQSDTVIYGDGEIIDIDIYCNRPDMPHNKVTSQLLQYYTDCKWFYTEVYKICKKITKSGSKNIDSEIYRWKRKAMNYLDTQASWAFNDNIISNVLVEILVRKKEHIIIGRKIVGRAGNKTVTCSIRPDDEMPYLTAETVTDEFGVEHPVGVRERVDMITNPLAIINRTIPMVMYEGSATFIMDRARKHAATLPTQTEQKEFLFDILTILNPKYGAELEELYAGLSKREQKRFIEDMISLDDEGRLRTDNGMYLRWEAFNPDFKLRDAIIEVYEKYGDVLQPYHIFVPKPKWGRDIHIGQDCIGYQYIMVLKQSGEKGFSIRSAGSISDESLPEKSHSNKQSKDWKSSKPIRFGEYESPNFMIITNPEDFALITALYRASVDGRRFMYEAILSEDGEYNIPDNFTSRTSEILQVYLKSLGVRMRTIIDEDEFVGEEEHDNEIVGYKLGNGIIFCTPNEMYYLKKLWKLHKKFMKQNPDCIDDVDEAWDYILKNLPFKKKDLPKNVITLFMNNLELFSQRGDG